MFRPCIRGFSTRAPLIKFRQGRAPEEHHAPPQPAPQGRANPRAATSAAIIEDWQLPAKYRRRPISEEECQAINLGGAI
ncbi:uncharacterized protein LOC143914318 [Arctopsyche grandis]|uniref:uncharacterized protein LOC143914318 n=1 Tax=Arctopsyche grandis TaxID=121162 RepID=UPI00406D8740